MNRKGQTLVLFVIILPLILIGVWFFVDFTLIVKEKVKLNGIMDNISSYIDKYDEDKINDYLYKNDKDISISINYEDKSIVLKKSVKTIIGKFIGIENYDIIIARDE